MHRWWCCGALKPSKQAKPAIPQAAMSSHPLRSMHTYHQAIPSAGKHTYHQVTSPTTASHAAINETASWYPPCLDAPCSEAAIQDLLAQLDAQWPEAATWLLGLAISWLGTEAIDTCSARAAGWTLLQRYLWHSAGSAAAASKGLLEHLSNEACLSGAMWDFLAVLVRQVSAGRLGQCCIMRMMPSAPCW